MNNQKNIAYLLLCITVIILNVINVGNTGIDFIIILTSSLVDALMLFSYISFIKKPIITICLLLARQFVLIVQDLYLGLTLGEAVVSNGILILVLMVVLIIQTNIITTTSTTAKGRVKELLFFNRKPLKLGVPVQIILYSIMLICVTTVAKSEMLNTISSDKYVRLFGSLAVTLPVFEILAIASTSVIAYTVIVLYELVKIYTLISLYVVDGLNFQTVAYSILQLGIIVYMFIKINKERKTEKNE